MTISDEAVEAAAGYLPHSTDCEWRPERDCSCWHLRTATIRAALEAAAPFIRAEALEEAAAVAERGEGGGTDSGECDDWSVWLRARAAEMRQG